MQQRKIIAISVDEDIEKLFRKGLLHYKEGRLEQAQDICQHILEKQQHAESLHILGMIAHQQRQYSL